jgi:hypothetical protein
MTYTERNIVDTYTVLFNNRSEVCKIDYRKLDALSLTLLPCHPA